MSTDDTAEGDASGQARSVRFRQQFFKTQLCQLFLRGRCHRRELCRYAHGEEDLRQAPDLCKTALCPEGSNCKDANCRFAHHRRELRATNEFLKKDPCRYFIRSGRCALGKSCRYSHSLDLFADDGQEDQADRSQESSTAGPTQDSQEHIERVRKPSEPKKSGSFQGRRDLYGAVRAPALDVDGGPARSMSTPIDKALRLPPAPPLLEDSFPQLTRVRQAHPMLQAEANLPPASFLFQDASIALESNNYLDANPAGLFKSQQVFLQDRLPKDTRFAPAIPTELSFHKDEDKSHGSSTYTQELIPQRSGQTAAAPTASFDRNVRIATNEDYYIPQFIRRSAAFPKDSHADDHSFATALPSGRIPDSIGPFRGHAKIRGGLSGVHFDESRVETGLPSGPYAFEDLDLGLQHSHDRVLPNSSASSEPFQPSVGALPAAAAARTPEGLGAMSFWL